MRRQPRRRKPARPLRTHPLQLHPLPAAGTVTADQVDAVAKQLWCPLCSGVRLDACELKACSQMKEVIGEKLAQGVDVQTIKNYFVAQYGPQVLGEPPMEGFNWLAWVLPVVALIVRWDICLLPYPQDGAYGSRCDARRTGAWAGHCECRRICPEIRRGTEAL